MLFYLEITTINIYSDQKDGRYYVEDDVTITAEFGNPSAIEQVRWQKKDALMVSYSQRSVNHTLSQLSATANNEYIIIDTSVSDKYMETRDEKSSMLKIRNCCESDAGSYSLLVTCEANVDIYSNSIDIRVVTGKHIFSIIE